MDGTIRDTFKYGASDEKVIELPYISNYLEEKPGTDVENLIDNIDEPITALDGVNETNRIVGDLQKQLTGVNVNDLKEVVFQIPGILVKIIDDHDDIESTTIKTKGNDSYVKALDDTCVQ